jgi:hypothetical protein
VGDTITEPTGELAAPDAAGNETKKTMAANDKTGSRAEIPIFADLNMIFLQYRLKAPFDG